MKITVPKIVGYTAGLVLLLVALVAALVSPISGLMLLIAAVLSTPVTRKAIGKRLGLSVSRWAIVLVVVFMVFSGGIVGIMSGISQTADNQNSQSSDVTQQELTHSVGETFTVGSNDATVEYNVTEVRMSEAGSGTSVVYVFLTVENTGDESVDIFADTFRLVDAQDREYETDSDLMTGSQSSLNYQQLNPGVQKKGFVAFEVPSDQENRQLRIEPLGVLSNDNPHYVELE